MISGTKTFLLLLLILCAGGVLIYSFFFYPDVVRDRFRQSIRDLKVAIKDKQRDARTSQEEAEYIRSEIRDIELRAQQVEEMRAMEARFVEIRDMVRNLEGQISSPKCGETVQEIKFSLIEAQKEALKNAPVRTPPLSDAEAPKPTNLSIGGHPYRNCFPTLKGTIECNYQRRNFAILMPFVAPQINHLLSNLRLWSFAEFFPCNKENPIAQDVDLIFYISRDLETVVDTIENEISNSPMRSCFRNVFYRSRYLPPEQDVYGIGTVEQFYGVFLNETFKQTLPPYDYIYYMEPDVRPLRSNWLDIVYFETIGPPFWQKGSIARDWHEIRDDIIAHINGNALYNFRDPVFIEYIKASKGAFHYYLSLDQDLAALRYKKLYPNAFHMFIYSEFVVNHPAWNLICPEKYPYCKEVDSLQEILEHIRKSLPNTALLHGKKFAGFMSKLAPTPYDTQEMRDWFDHTAGLSWFY